MKIFASIMAFVVLFLSVEPGLQALSTKAETQCCCGGQCIPFSDKQTTPKQENKDESNTNDICNPFLSCSNCIGYTVKFPNIVTQIEGFTGTKVSQLTLQIKPQFYPDFWQPPKIS